MIGTFISETLFYLFNFFIYHNFSVFCPPHFGLFSFRRTCRVSLLTIEIIMEMNAEPRRGTERKKSRKKLPCFAERLE